MIARHKAALVVAALLVSGSVSLVWGHDAPLDPYGCHSNKRLYGNTNTRECHIDLLAGQVFKSPTDEYKAYIAAQKIAIADLTTKLTACTKNCPPPVASLTLEWNANGEPDLAGYRVYYGSRSNVYDYKITLGKVTSMTMTNLTHGAMYYCVITAFDRAGNESTFSQEVSKLVP